MKYSLACVLLTTATALANPTPIQQGDRPSKPLQPLPSGWEYSEDTRDGSRGPRIVVPALNPKPMIRDPSPCIERCLESKHRDAGCGHAKDWACLCRYDGFAPEIRGCVTRFCHSELDIGSIYIQNEICKQTVAATTGGHRRPPPPPKKGN